MGDRGRPDLPRHLDQGNRLLGPLGGDGEGIDLAAEHVPLDQKSDEAMEDRVAGVHLVMGGRAHRLGLAADRGALGGGAAAGIHIDGVDRVAELAEPGDAVGGIESPGEGQGERFMHIA